MRQTVVMMADSRAPRIRTARADEIERLLEIQLRASLIWDAYREQLTAHPEVITLQAEQVTRGDVRVITDADDRPVGFSAVINLGESIELDGLFVAPEHMRRGFGGALVGDLVARAGGTGARRIHVTGQPGAVPFYERHGFRQTGEAETQFGPAPRLTLVLSH
jgi:GNAT superfamily N-acetyltransferase